MLDLNAAVKEVYITDLKGKKHMLTGTGPEAQINAIRIYEGMEMPTIAAEIEIIDTAINLIATAPIVGTEEVVIKLIAPIISQKEYTYKFVVYGIRNRIVSKNAQMYVLDLFTLEALKNEVLRVGKKLEGTGEQIVNDILKNYLETDKKIDTEPCKYKMKEIPSLKRPFDLITSILPECVSGSTNPQQKAQPSSTNKSGSTTKAAGTTDSPTETTATIISGTAGYAFFETYDGYVFKSYDQLIKSNEKHKGYLYGYAQTPESDAEKNAFKILNYSFGSQENILKKMRYGVYSSMIAFFNSSTLEYEEYMFSLDKEYQQMAHLGTDEKIPEQIKNFSKYPSRIMLQFYDHETYHNGIDIANPQQAGSKGGTPFPDFRKQWMAQSISRSIIMKNQILNITIPINLELRAGDKLRVRLPNQSVSSEREKQLYDEKNSGVYLINKVSYEVLRDNSKGLIAVSNLELIRDNLGS
jgi:hypothetical protein